MHCIDLLGCAPKSSLDCIFLIQNYAVRPIAYSSLRTPSLPIFSRIKTLNNSQMLLTETLHFFTVNLRHIHPFGSQAALYVFIIYSHFFLSSHVVHMK